MNSAKAFEMKGVSKAFRFFSLEGISLALEPGQVMGPWAPMARARAPASAC